MILPRRSIGISIKRYRVFGVDFVWFSMNSTIVSGTSPVSSDRLHRSIDSLPYRDLINRICVDRERILSNSSKLVSVSSGNFGVSTIFSC